MKVQNVVIMGTFLHINIIIVMFLCSNMVTENCQGQRDSSVTAGLRFIQLQYINQYF
jgi:hypothetical protein